MGTCAAFAAFATGAMGRYRTGMVRWLRHLMLLVAVLGTAASLPAAGGAEHCKGGQPGPANQHHADHDKDTDPAAQCPHCPPADCHRHSHCAVSIDPGSTTASSRPTPVTAGSSYIAVGIRPAALRSAPPTPPPQVTIR